MATEVKFEVWLQRAFTLYKQNLGILIAAQLLATILAFGTAFILAGPMCAGMILITLRLLRGTEPKPEISALFEGFKYFGQSFAFLLVWALIGLVLGGLVDFLPLVGPTLAALVRVVVATLMIFGMFMIVDRGVEFWPASQASIAAVRTAFWPLLGYTLVALLLGAVGVVACFIGIFATLPFTACAMAVAYEEFCATPARP